MKIVYLNAWRGTVKDQLLEFVKQQVDNTDVFCFQEATDEMKQLCKPVLNGYIEMSDHKSLSESHNFLQSIFIKKEIEVVSSGTLLADDMEAGLAIYVEVKVGPDSVYICNMHGVAYPGDKLDDPVRIRQSEAVIKFFEDKQAPVIIGGDFNVNPDTQSIEMFEWFGYKNLIKDFNIETTRNHLAWDRFPTNKKYYSDYLFINDKIRCKEFRVLKVEVSDHLPLILEI